MISNGYGLVCSAVAEAISPAPILLVSEWAQRFRRLSSKETSKQGRWRNELVPHAVEIMDVLSAHHPCQRVVYIKSTQTVGTEIGNNMVGSVIDTQRCPMMVVQPTVDLAERWSKQRLASMIAETPSLAKKIGPVRTRDSGNTTLLKQWPGGMLVIAGANSAAGLRSTPCKYLFADEVDAYIAAADYEGDRLALAEARLDNFPDRKVFICSTPTIESLSIINREFIASDQRRRHVPCPHCGGYQILEWEQLHWPEGRPERASYLCTECGKDIEETSKTAMFREGKWIPDRPDLWREEFPKIGAIGFHINALYSPRGLGRSWGELAAEWEKKRGDPTQLKTFVNTRLGKCVEDPNEKLDWEDLKKRAGQYESRTIPDGCLDLTAGVDVQSNRWAVMVLGHGRNGKKWIIDYTEIDGDPTKEDEWLKDGGIDEYLNQKFVNGYGYPMGISLRAFDSGYLQDDVIRYTRPREYSDVIAVKGSSNPGKQIIGGVSKVDYTYRGQLRKNGARQWQVGSSEAKRWLFLVLAADGKEAIDSDRRIQFPSNLSEAAYMMLTAEVYDPNKMKWVKIRSRNETTDCFVYALAASMHRRRRIHERTPAEWDKIESIVQPRTRDLFSSPEPTKTPPIYIPGAKPARVPLAAGNPRRQRPLTR